jgi:hypothetical protein
MTSNALEFVSRGCKQGLHPECHQSWMGLGFTANCNCVCHRKNAKELAGVESPEASTFTIVQPSEEMLHDDR